MKPRTAVKKISDKRLQSLGGKVPFSSIASKPKPIKKRNAERKARRAAKYKVYLSSVAWKKLRLAVFERDLFWCVGSVPCDACEGTGNGAVHGIDDWCGWCDATGWCRCEYRDASERGKGLICDHLTYARFGHENLEDLRTLCTSCNAKLTVSERANWQR